MVVLALSERPTIFSVSRVVVGIRLFLENYWEARGTNSTAKCIETSLFLAPILNEQVGGEWEVWCGLHNPPGAECAEAHCWVREKYSGLNADLTGDQFDLERVIVDYDREMPYQQAGIFEDSDEWLEADLAALRAAYQRHSGLAPALA